MYTFVANKSFGQLLYISPKNFIFSETFNSECSYIEVWFTDQNFKPLEIEDKINIILVILNLKNDTLFSSGFLSFAKIMNKNICKNVSKKW